MPDPGGQRDRNRSAGEPLEPPLEIPHLCGAQTLPISALNSWKTVEISTPQCYIKPSDSGVSPEGRPAAFPAPENPERSQLESG
jgi:hypothetical protein